jgi:hypothetical protein
MYCIVIVCPGVSEHLGTEAAADIEKHFDAYRPHHQNVRCSFAAGELTLIAENDSTPTDWRCKTSFRTVSARSYLKRLQDQTL